MKAPMNASPCSCGTLTQKAMVMAAEYKISLRTAYRHLARGTVPSADRRIGMDGKTYPAPPLRLGYNRTPLERELALTRQALNRADKKACEQGIGFADVHALRRIVATATEMVARWAGVHGL